jgi:hypothetical protein
MSAQLEVNSLVILPRIFRFCIHHNKYYVQFTAQRKLAAAADEERSEADRSAMVGAFIFFG